MGILDTYVAEPRLSWGPMLVLHGIQDLDPPWDLPLPGSCLERLGPELVVCAWFDPCLRIYPAGKWERIMAALCAAKDLRFDARLLIESVRRSGVSFEPGSEGACRLSAVLRRRASIHRQVLVASSSDHLEIWNPELWADRDALSPDHPENVVDAV